MTSSRRSTTIGNIYLMIAMKNTSLYSIIMLVSTPELHIIFYYITKLLLLFQLLFSSIVIFYFIIYHSLSTSSPRLLLQQQHSSSSAAPRQNTNQQKKMNSNIERFIVVHQITPHTASVPFHFGEHTIHSNNCDFT